MTEAHVTPSDASRDLTAWLEPGVHPLRHPWMHLTLFVVSTLDITFTWIILFLGGVEVNPVAKLVIDHWGLNGAIAFKFGLMLFVVVVAEVVARTSAGAGRRLAVAAVLISAVPVVWSSFLIWGNAAG